MNIKEALNEANYFLKKNNIRSYQLDSEILMSKVLKKKREKIILNPDKYLKFKNYNYFKKLIRERSLGKPIAYITGKKEFWKYEFKMCDKVLIPRPDTELIIEEVLRLTRNKNRSNILDVGVGSGCLLLSILKEKNKFNGVGIDISQKCLNLSKINVDKLGLKNRVRFFKSDVDNFNYGKYDLIISNPPYINKLCLKYLDKEVYDFEPMNALNGGLDGLSEIRKVINRSSELIKINGKLILEIAFDQKDKVKRLLKKKGFYINKVKKDLAKNYRCIISTKIWKIMVTFRNNNNRRNNFRRGDRNFQSNNERKKFSSSFVNHDNFQRKTPGRNNHNASRLIDKYNNLAREALSGGDKILSENYFQHADHFTRVLGEQENYKKNKNLDNLSNVSNLSSNKEEKKEEKIFDESKEI